MFEYPEIINISRQMEAEIIGKTIEFCAIKGYHRCIYTDECRSARYNLLPGGTVIKIDCLAPDIYIMLDNGYGVLICHSGNKLRYNKSVLDVPKRYNIILKFTDGANITYAPNSPRTLVFYAISHKDWKSRIQNNQKFDPLSSSFDEYIVFFRNKHSEDRNKSVRVFLSNDILGVMKAFAAEILLYAKVHPKTQVKFLSEEENKRIYNEMKRILTEAANSGGRETEFDLYGKSGRYVTMSQGRHVGKNCPICGTVLILYTPGGYHRALCPNCQVYGV